MGARIKYPFELDYGERVICVNFFAHGRMFVDRPYVLAGTAVPDWLNLVDRRRRARKRRALPMIAHPDSDWADIARGIVRHHDDDRWFHATRDFTELSLHLTVLVRGKIGRDEGMRPSFLGHILVELLLDDRLIKNDPERLELYYKAVGELDAPLVARVAGEITGGDTARLATVIQGFHREKFLYDYASDERLHYRLNQVMRRVKLPSLAGAFVDLLPVCRQLVDARVEGLLGDQGPLEK